jgi:hypothetical protein
MARKNKPQHDEPAHAGRRPRARRLAAVAGLAAGVALLGGIAAPGAATANAAPPGPRVSEHTITGTGQAGAAAAYWTRARMLSARNADRIQLTSPPDAHAAPAPRPSGPAGQVPGAAPVESLRGPAGRAPVRAHSALPPRSGPTGSNWPGNFYLPPATTTGKVFFTTTGNGQMENWVCSASTVNSNGKDAVITAGHCVYGSLGGEVPGGQL